MNDHSDHSPEGESTNPSERLALKYPLASRSDRFLAALIDILILNLN